MPTIQYSNVLHRDKHWILAKFEFDTALNRQIGKVAGAKWSKTLKGWLLPDTVDNRAKYGMGNEAIVKNGAAIPEYNNRKIKTELDKKPIPIASKQLPVSLPNQHGETANIISPNNKVQLDKYMQHLILKAYSPSTIKTYRSEYSIFLSTLKMVDAQSLTTQRLKDYLEYCFTKLKLSENTVHSRMNALKFYYEQVLGREKFFWKIPRPKKPFLLPKLLNETELGKLFNALTNKKHKAMLFTAYSAGLRVSEIVNLRLIDIDSKRMQMLICCAKGKKDRYVNLSPVLLDILRKYIQEYTPRPKEYLFESEQTGSAYPTRTVQQIFTNAKNIAGIKKEVGIHSLRHSFATHLLEKGTDIKYIKDLLGHFNIKTTEKYLHVSKQKLVNIASPLDDLMTKEKIDW